MRPNFLEVFYFPPLPGWAVPNEGLGSEGVDSNNRLKNGSEMDYGTPFIKDVTHSLFSQPAPSAQSAASLPA